jgi:hypothetical protein
MIKKVTCFLPAGTPDDLEHNISELGTCEMSGDIIVFSTGNQLIKNLPSGVKTITVPSLFSTEAILKIALSANTEFILFYTKTLPLHLGQFSIERMVHVASDTRAGLIYSDFYSVNEGQYVPNPVIEYQSGSLRDDFNFGSLLLFRTDAVREAVSDIHGNLKYAGLYNLRLRISQRHSLFHIPEFLYTEEETDIRKSDEKQFDYVDPRNRDVQVEMEEVCLTHLKDIGAWLKPVFRKINFSETGFDNEVSVIIPVLNRVRTITDAVQSALHQKCSFGFNVIIVDNHSSDGTNERIRLLSMEDKRVIHVIPERYDLGIGGCWNTAIFSPFCGKFAVQLDSDDLYIDEHVLSKIVEGFYLQNCAMLIGSYQMVNFKLERIPPGLVDHREWTPENGRNNALRINGFGAPRAFYTPVLRKIQVPNVSYGEDYALGLNISRYFQIGRIYEPLYLCRRWEENSDASLNIAQINKNNFYKDKIRTMELLARQIYVNDGQKV